MFRIDFYVQHLIRKSARAVLLTSGTPVRFRFDDDDRASNASIDHAQIVQLVQEAAPPASIDELRRTRRTSFQHAAAGALVRVEVDATRGDAWEALVNQPSVLDADLTLVVPGDPDASFLMDKLTSENPAAGNRMPLFGGALSGAEIANVRAWIAEGAADN